MLLLMTQKLYFSGFAHHAHDDDSGTPRQQFQFDVLLDGIISKVIHVIHIDQGFTERPSFGWSLAKQQDQSEIDPSTQMFEVMEGVLANETGFAYHMADFPVGLILMDLTDETLYLTQESCRYPVFTRDRILYDQGLNPILDADNAFSVQGEISILTLIEQVVY